MFAKGTPLKTYYHETYTHNLCDDPVPDSRLYAIQKVPAMRKYSGHISNVFRGDYRA